MVGWGSGRRETPPSPPGFPREGLGFSDVPLSYLCFSLTPFFLFLCLNPQM